MKKNLYVVVLLIFSLLFMTACSNGGTSDSSSTNDSEGKGDSKQQVTLTLFTTMGGDLEKEVLENIIAEFEAQHSHIKIDANFPGGSYEELMRVKMAANDMPDLFDTHGWSKIRYGEYVEDLKDMEWVKNLDPALDLIVKDEDGKVYTYPLNQAKDGMTYNANLLEEYGIEPPTTFDEFITALEVIKEKSNGEVVPLWFGAGDSGALAQFLDQMATPLLITDSENAFGDELLAGTFDWSNYTYLPEKLKEMYEKKLINPDVLTARSSQAVDLMAQGKVGFTFVGGAIGTETSKVNPDRRVGIVPVPAIHEGDRPSWIGGERFTLSVSKNSKYKEEAKQFIEFMTQPENAKKMAEATSLPAALTNVEADNYFSDYFKKYSDIEVQPYFDRVYLPSGMWDVMINTAAELLAGALTPEGVSKIMNDEYHRLRAQ